MARARFRVSQIRTDGAGMTGWISMTAVADAGPVETQLWTATPSGRLELYISNPDAFGRFVPGQHYELELRLAEPEYAG